MTELEIEDLANFIVTNPGYDTGLTEDIHRAARVFLGEEITPAEADDVWDAIYGYGE